MITDIRHPCYTNESSYWRKWRTVFNSGEEFIQTYLKRMEKRETREEFNIRRTVTYSPGFIKVAVNQIKDTFYSRSQDVTRLGGSLSYQQAISGRNGGVDRCGSSMSYFICDGVLRELLTMKRVGVYVDMPELVGPTLLDKLNKTPYIYYYPVEDILSWSWNDDHQLSSVLLRDERTVVDSTTNLPSGVETAYRHLYLTPSGVVTDLYSIEGNLVSTKVLNLSKIPFKMPSLFHSIIEDAVNYQIALLNIESSDINYILTANFPFYTEQYNPTAASVYVKGEESNQEISVGVTKGRRYGKDLERPGFISPSSEPLKASMLKAEQIKKDIRELINFSVSDLKDSSSLTSGLSYIGLVLEDLENAIAEFWGMYEGEPSAVVLYPVDYKTLTVDDRMKEIEKDIELADSISSQTFKKEVTKRIVRLSLASSTSIDTLQRIETEIDDSDVPFAPYKNITQDVVTGLASLRTASKARGYPDGDVEQANVEHAERLLRIQAAQAPATPSAAGGLNNPAARGVLDLSLDPQGGKKEKVLANDNTRNGIPEDQTRGGGK